MEYSQKLFPGQVIDAPAMDRFRIICLELKLKELSSGIQNAADFSHVWWLSGWVDAALFPVPLGQFVG